jgi:hypothetical protein
LSNTIRIEESPHFAVMVDNAAAGKSVVELIKMSGYRKCEFVTSVTRTPAAWIRWCERTDPSRRCTMGS